MRRAAEGSSVQGNGTGSRRPRSRSTRRRPWLLLGSAVWLVLLVPIAASSQVIDAFDSVAAWSAHPSDGVGLTIAPDAGRRGNAMRLDFDFHGHGGHAIARRAVDLDLPSNFELTFWMRAAAPVNNLEVKLIDSSGANVWWMNRRDFVFPRTWSEVVTKKRQISFAWGPLGGGEPHRIAAIEIVVTAGTGGAGSVWVDDLALVALPPPVTGPVEHGPWRAAGGTQQLTIDLGSLREIGGLRIDWDPVDFARDFAIELSRDGEHFASVRDVVDNGWRRELIHLPDQEARLLRLSMRRSSSGHGYAIRAVEVEPVDWAPTPNDFFAIVARNARRGDYPRYLAGEQPYWTVIGADGADPEALVGEDGNLEPFKGGFSIEPFLITSTARIVTWADVHPRQSLAEGDLPIPSVRWVDRGLSLTMTSAVTRDSRLLVRYRVRSGQKVTLALAIRPFQVDPSTQFLNTTGGVSPIHEIALDGRDVVVNGERRIHLRTLPTRVHAVTFDQGDLVDCLRAAKERTSCVAAEALSPRRAVIRDPVGYASAALEFAVGPGTSDIEIEVPLAADGRRGTTALRGRDSFDAQLAGIAGEWREKLHRVAIELPGAPEIANTIRTNLAYMLIQRDGAALEPGSRSYDRAWIRDGSLIASVLLRLGHPDEAKAFAGWFAGFQYADGKVPCCVDRRGADPVPENDSHGELIFLVAEIQRYTGDTVLVRRLWPHVDAAARYIEALRAENHGQFEGLLTESISHEGYSAKPVHSYWDDVFGVKGLEDAAMLAGVLGLDSRQRELEAEAASFYHDLEASILRTIAEHHLDYVPASAEFGDFDPTSTAIGISPLGLRSLLPAPELGRTYERYWAAIQKPREAYTPYEMRIIGALVRLGERDRALALVDRFLRDRRPAAWNEWAEVVGADLRKPRFIGDMPHSWIASDFIRSILEAIAYDDEDGALVVGAGVSRKWIGAGTLHVGPLPTVTGTIDIRMRASGRRVTVWLRGTAAAKRIVVKSPGGRPVRSVTVDGQAARLTRDGVVVTHLPARVVFEE